MLRSRSPLFTQSERRTSRYIPGPVSQTITVDVTVAQDPEFEYYIEPEAFLSLLDKYGIPQNTDCQYSFIITRTEGKVYSVAGTPDYVMQDRSRKRRKPVRPNCPEWWEFCRAFALKPVSCGFVNAMQLLHPDNPMSVFSFPANGGIHTDKFAINLATNHIIPLDHSLDICTHKKGWSYIHQYMGRFAFHWALDIVTAEREGNHFSLGQEYSMETDEEREWFAKAVHKVCRLLVGFGAPEDSILSVELKARNTTLAFPVFPVAEIQHSLGALLLKRVDISRREVDSPLDKDPLVQEIRRHYTLVQKATHDAVSGYELKFLTLVKALADSLHIRGGNLDTAYMKAYMSRNLADLEIYKELVHSALRKTPLFSAVYGYKADPEAVFVCGKRDA